MSKAKSSKVFQMFLNSVDGFPSIIDNVNTGNITYRIDWDSFFNREQYNYKHCRVRTKYITNTNTFYNYIFTGWVLVSNLVGPNNSKNVPNTVLGLIELGTNIGLSPATVRGFLYVNTMQTEGTEILIPTGQQNLNLSIWRDGYGAIGITQFSNVDMGHYDFVCILTFELYD